MKEVDDGNKKSNRKKKNLKKAKSLNNKKGYTEGLEDICKNKENSIENKLEFELKNYETVPSSKNSKQKKQKQTKAAKKKQTISSPIKKPPFFCFEKLSEPVDSSHTLLTEFIKHDYQDMNIETLVYQAHPKEKYFEEYGHHQQLLDSQDKKQFLNSTPK